MHALVKLDSRAKAMGARITELPDFLKGLQRSFLADLGWTDPKLGLQKLGYWPVVDRHPRLDVGQQYGGFELKADKNKLEVIRLWKAVPLSPEMLQERCEQLAIEHVGRVTDERDRRIARGKFYVFPDGQTGTVQLRGERDVANINALATAATALQALESAELLEFRDEENIRHPLTASEALKLSLALAQWRSAHYTAAWTHKDAITALAKTGDFAALQDYNIDEGWPQP